MESERIRSPPSLLFTRQILALESPELEKRLEKAWGQMRAGPEALGKRREELGKELNLGFLAKPTWQKDESFTSGPVPLVTSCTGREETRARPDGFGPFESGLYFGETWSTRGRGLGGLPDDHSSPQGRTDPQRDGVEAGKNSLPCACRFGDGAGEDGGRIPGSPSELAHARRFAGRVEQGGTTRPRGLPDASRASRLTDL